MKRTKLVKHSLTGCARVLVSALIFAGSLFLFQGEFAGATDSTIGQSLGSGKRVNLIALPFSRTQRVDPPERFLRRGLDAPSSVTITVNYLPPGKGQGRDRCAAWPGEAKAAVNKAVAIWSALVTSAAPITIDACWATNLPNPVLGSSGINDYFKNFTGAPQTETWYPSSLANKLHGSTIDSSQSDMYLSYNVRYPFYFGTDGNCPAGKYDLVSIVLHEIAHGLGFTGAVQASGNQAGYGQKNEYLPEPFDRFVQNGSRESLTDTTLFPNPSTQLFAQVTSNNLYFTGAKAKAANNGESPQIYAPSKWDAGSSYSHLDWDTFENTANALMVYAIPAATAIHSPGAVTLGILEDIGWTVAADTTRTLTVSKSGAGTGTVSSAPRGIHYGATRTADFGEGDYVTLIATAGPRSKFVGWSGTQCAGTGSCRILMDEDKSETATFAPCTYTISPTNKTLAGHQAANIPVSFVASDAGCPAPDITPSAEDAGWLSISNLVYRAATGKGSVRIRLTANSSSSSPRIGSVDIGGATFTVTQDGKPCVLTLKPAVSPLIARAGDSGQVNVIVTPSDCSWYAAADAADAWLTTPSTAYGTGSGSFPFTAAANTGNTRRNGHINIVYMWEGHAAIKVYTVRQSNR